MPAREQGDAMDILHGISDVVQDIWVIITLLMFIIKPLRQRLLGGKCREKDKEEATRCNLRSNMLEIYYKGQKTRTIHIYEYENFMQLYDVYKKLGGNSFIDKVHKEIEEWTVIA